MTKNRFITGYSGLRALAVIGVILYHLNPNTFIGGYLGVLIFFVLSGYLVTAQMLKAYDETGYFDEQKFYWGRIKKLYPSLIAVLWLAAAYIFVFQRNLLAKLWQIVAANLFSVYNFWQIFNGQSYFERFAVNESPFVHLWTMSINGQFYLLWPLVIYLLVKYGKNKKVLGGALLGLSLISALEMALMFWQGVDLNRIYYGTDTRFFALGLGAVLAVICPLQWSQITSHKMKPYLLDGIGLIALSGLLILFLCPIMNPEHSFPYLGGMLLFTILTVIMVGIIAQPASHWNQWLTNPVFNWFGSRSYGIYLYQFPVMIFFEDQVTNLADHILFYHLCELVLIALLSELSYRYIERPLGRLTWEQTKSFLHRLVDWRQLHYAGKIKTSLAAVIFVLGSVSILVSPLVKAQNFNQSQLARRIKTNRKEQQRENRAMIAKLKKTQKKELKKSKLISEAQKSAKRYPFNRSFVKYGISQVDLQLAHKVQLTAIGDSVMAGSSNDLMQLMPKSIIDAAVSRQLSVSYGLLNQYQAQHALADNVLIALGTNGPFPMSDLRQLMHQIGPKRQVFWINTHVPNKPWQNQVNQLLAQAAKQYHNLVIIDWYNYSKNHQDWFYDDLTHPTPSGSKYYSAFIVKTVVEHAKF